jgi:hypothetical protein
MKKYILLFIIGCLFQNIINAQKYIEPIIGYQNNFLNINDTKKNGILNQAYIGLSFSNKKREQYEYAFNLSSGIPITKKIVDSSFTLNIGLPLFSPAYKYTSFFSLSASFVQKYKFIDFSEKDKLIFLFGLGFTYQSIMINYEYDKINYVILNPDKSIRKFGLHTSFGIQYLHYLKKGRIFIQSEIESPIFTKKTKYYTNLKAILPLRYSLGYSIEI